MENWGIFDMTGLAIFLGTPRSFPQPVSSRVIIVKNCLKMKMSQRFPFKFDKELHTKAVFNSRLTFIIMRNHAFQIIQI
jgi:hypothetical protein